MNISLCERKSGQMLQAVTALFTNMRILKFKSQLTIKTTSSLLLFFVKLLPAKPKHATGEAACREKRGRKIPI